MNLEINPRKVFIILLTIISFLLFFNIIAVVSKYVLHLYDYNAVKVIYNLFSFNMERNFPTLYSALALFITSISDSVIGLPSINVISNGPGRTSAEISRQFAISKS